MKTVILIAATLVSFNSLALVSAGVCSGEAQIIAKVDQIIDGDMFNCVVSIDSNSIVQYNVNQTCPLDMNEVLKKGVALGLINGHDCPLSSGDDISGVIVKTAWDTLVLE